MAACRARARCIWSSQFAYASAPPGGVPVGGAGSRCVPGTSSRPLSLELIEELLLCACSVTALLRAPQELVHGNVATHLRLMAHTPGWDAALAATRAKCAPRRTL